MTGFPSSTLLPFFLGVLLLKPNSRKKGTLIIKGLLGNLDEGAIRAWVAAEKSMLQRLSII